jgi:hypothetical protein
MKCLRIFPLLQTVLLLLCSIVSVGQLKYEREYSLKSDRVPRQASAFIAEIFKDTKVQWYGEENDEGTSIEAKLKSSGKTYSIEFSDSGEIQDVEVLSNLDALPANSRSAIMTRLRDEFSSFKVSKTQVQWTGSVQDLKEALLKRSANELTAGITIKFDLIVRAKKGKRFGYYEVLADTAGRVENIREIIQPNSDNLIY